MPAAQAAHDDAAGVGANRPALQPTHAAASVAPARLPNRPAPHRVHTPPPRYAPGPQLVHTADVVAPAATVLYSAAAHVVQLEPPAAAAYVLRAHAAGAAPPPAQLKPGAHGTHVPYTPAQAVDPGVVDAYPGAQLHGLQAAARPAAKVPAAHSAHALGPAATRPSAAHAAGAVTGNSRQSPAVGTHAPAQAPAPAHHV